MVMYPNKAILDGWESLGNPGWSFDDLAPYFRRFAMTHEPTESVLESDRMSNYYDPALTASEAGPVNLTFTPSADSTHTAWMNTFANLGLQLKSDPRSGTAIGAFQNSLSIKPGTNERSSSASAYLTKSVRQRANLTLLTRTIVKKIVFDQSKGLASPHAAGIIVRLGSGEETILSARMEIILAAGALRTPQILELSGVGRKSLLEQFDIPVVLDNPNVGEHVQGHPLILQSFEAGPDLPSMDVFRDPGVVKKAFEQYQTTSTGPLADGIKTCAYVPLVDGDGPLSPTASNELWNTYVKMPSGDDPMSAYEAAEKKIVQKVLVTPTEPVVEYLILPAQTSVPEHPVSFADHMSEDDKEGNYITVISLLGHPLSQGSVHIQSSNIDDKPL